MKVIKIALSQLVVDYAHKRWDSASPNFSHGQDMRSSDGALVTLFYGGLLKASEHDWQNAGRVLIDRTYVKILFETYHLSMPTRDLDVCCRLMDDFIRLSLIPNWFDIHPWLQPHVKSSILDDARAVNSKTGTPTSPLRWLLEWPSEIAIEILGGEEYLDHAMLLLFYTCPGLPFMPATMHTSTIRRESNQTMRIECLNQSDSSNKITLPMSEYGTDSEKQIVQNMLRHCDWWYRRLVWAANTLEFT